MTMTTAKRTTRYRLALTLCLLLPAGLLQANLLQTGFNAVYEVQHQQIYLGDAQRHFTRQGNSHWRYTSVTRAEGLAKLFIKDTITESTTLLRQKNTLLPVDYDYLQAGGDHKKHYHLHFDWQKKQLINSAQPEPQPIETGVQDLLSFQLQIMLDLQAGKNDPSYVIADNKRIASYTLMNKGKTKITTPLKTFTAVKLESNRTANGARFYIWCAPELQYLPVKISKVDEDGDQTDFTLKSFAVPRAQ